MTSNPNLIKELILMFNKCVISAIKEDYSNITRILTDFKKELEVLPIGSLNIKYIKGRPCHYHYIPSTEPKKRGNLKYIQKNRIDFLEALSRRRFIETSIPILEDIIVLEDYFLSSYPDYNPQRIISSMPKAYKFNNFIPSIRMFSEHSKEWCDEPYIKSAIHPEHLIYSTPSGVKVRSKSELIIASELEIAGIPYRYEASLPLEGRNFYPDFTILNPKDKKIVYWEHFGMPDNPEYAASMNEKLSIYRRNKIIPWHNLIETYEMSGIPFNAHLIRNIIRQFLITL